MEGIYELHWQRREHGLLTIQLFNRCHNGVLSLVDTYESGPFDTRLDQSQWLARALGKGPEPMPV